MLDPTPAQRATIDNIVRANPGSTARESGSTSGSIIVSYPEGSMFAGAVVWADGSVTSQGFSSYPAGVAAQREHMTAIGAFDPSCELCKAYAETGGPSHKASPLCQSGGRNHCACRTCF